MAKRIALFWPGDARAKPNELALPNVDEATAQLERALKKLGREPYRVAGLPLEAARGDREARADRRSAGRRLRALVLRSAHDRRRRRQGQPAAARVSNFSGRWPGLVGLLNTGACLESLGRAFSRAWTDAPDMTTDDAFMERLDEWCTTGRIDYPRDEIAHHAPISRGGRRRARGRSRTRFARAPPLVMMLGDTSMGMINGYFGPRLLNRHGFTEHKIDQAWIIDRGKRIEDKRIDDALAFVKDRGVTFHWGRRRADFDEQRDARAAPRLPRGARHGRASSRPTASAGSTSSASSRCGRRRDFAEGLFNSACRPEVERRHHRVRDRGRPGQRRADGDAEAPPRSEGPPPGRDVPRRALGRDARRALPLGAAQLGLVRRVRVQPRSEHAARRALVSAAVALLPDAGRHVRRREPARQDDLGARVHQATACSGWTSGAARS